MNTKTFQISKNQNAFVETLLDGLKPEHIQYIGDTAKLILSGNQVVIQCEDDTYTFTVSSHYNGKHSVVYQVKLNSLDKKVLKRLYEVGLSQSALKHRIQYDRGTEKVYAFGILWDGSKYDISELFTKDVHGIPRTSLNRINRFIWRRSGHGSINYANFTRLINHLLRLPDEAYTEDQIEEIFKRQGRVNDKGFYPCFEYRRIFGNRKQEIDLYLEDFKSYPMRTKFDIFNQVQLNSFPVYFDVTPGGEDELKMIEAFCAILNDEITYAMCLEYEMMEVAKD